MNVLTIAGFDAFYNSCEFVRPAFHSPALLFDIEDHVDLASTSAPRGGLLRPLWQCCSHPAKTDNGGKEHSDPPFARA